MSETTLRYPPGILAACCLAWNPDYTLAEDVFRRSIRALLQGLTRDLYLFGTAGEGHSVTREQFLRICEVFRQETAQPDVRPMVGVISLSQGETVERIRLARAIGFRYFQISLPSWGALTWEETRRFFRDVCGTFPDCQFLHYNLLRTKRLVTPSEYAILADENPNLVATKNSTPDMTRIRGLLEHAPCLTHFFTEPGYAYGALTGPCGYLVSIASGHFSRAREYFAAGTNGDVRTLLTMQGELIRLTDRLLALGLPEAHMDGAFDQLFCRLHDPEFPLRLLPPYASITEETFLKFQILAREANWAG